MLRETWDIVRSICIDALARKLGQGTNPNMAIGNIGPSGFVLGGEKPAPTWAKRLLSWTHGVRFNSKSGFCRTIKGSGLSSCLYLKPCIHLFHQYRKMLEQNIDGSIELSDRLVEPILPNPRKVVCIFHRHPSSRTPIVTSRLIQEKPTRPISGETKASPAPPKGNLWPMTVWDDYSL
uniref:Uncharacterized protein n=1 Tax=Candidatus Kentrum sp. DK TaxID=2126562 RepID=A0A450TKQ8_9GAMM|nr:MAG: hypothetical protein BECKDK2373C_GA0170839_11793 [Candidatus Kentron sp. DK]